MSRCYICDMEPCICTKPGAKTYTKELYRVGTCTHQGCGVRIRVKYDAGPTALCQWCEGRTAQYCPTCYPKEAV